MHRAIETRYKGYRFRSRLEARWAVFFDTVGAKWEYEPEGYDLSDGRRYLPDFFIRFPEGSSQAKRHPGAGYWIEVKPITPTADEQDRLLQVVTFTKHHGSIVVGLPAENTPISVRKPQPPQSEEAQKAFDTIMSIANLPPLSSFDALLWADFLCMLPVSRPRVMQACIAARSARFEFGESGARS